MPVRGRQDPRLRQTAARPSDAQHFAAELVGRFERERPNCAISLATDSSLLTAIANDYAFEQVFASRCARWAHRVTSACDLDVRQFGQRDGGDRRGARAEMRIVALTGKGGGRAGELLAPGDVHLCVPHGRRCAFRKSTC